MAAATGSEDAAREAVALTAGAGGRRVILGLAGPPGAGKSTLAAAIVGHARALRGDAWAALLPMDGYHLSNAQLERLGILDRKGAPATFDADGYAAMLARVAADDGRDIYVPDYDRVVHHEPIAARLLIPSAARLVVTEGNYLAMDAPEWRAARRYLKRLWYVEASDELRESRLVQRQLAGGRDESAARDWVSRSDRPNGELVKASKASADRVIILGTALSRHVPILSRVLRLQNPPAGRLGLVVTFAAAALALAGCASGSSSSSAAGSSGSSAGSASSAPAGGSSGSQPSWAAALGPGTTVTPPQSVAPGHGSPGAAVQGYITALSSKDAAGACGYVQPSAQAECTSGFTQLPKDQLPYAKNEALGYVVTDGTQALAGITGSLCSPGSTPACGTNTDPAAIFSSAKPFATLWSQALAANNSSSNAYSLAPCIEVSGQWYIDISGS